MTRSMMGAGGPAAPARRGRGGFTLVELLVAITIIAILAAMLLGILARAGALAREAATKSLIAKLHGQVMLRWESYRTRRLPIDPQAIVLAMGGNPNNSRDVAQARLNALRELMRMELPQGWEDVNTYPTLLTVVPAVTQAYARRYDPARTTEQYEAAECLYMIVTMGLEDDSLGRERFSPKDIGDKDGDGNPEFIDGWGNPISFLRWAPGFVSELQPLDPATDLPDALNNHDPFDPAKLDMPAAGEYRGYRLFPLVYSAGADGVLDIISFTGGGINDPYAGPPTNNMAGTPDSTTGSFMGFVGTPDTPDDFSTDNIHNHQITAR